jgi:uncharacterized membrane protein
VCDHLDRVFEALATSADSSDYRCCKYNDNSGAAFAYGQGIQMRTLPGLCTFGSFTSASEAFAVNDAGWIVGSSKTCAGQTHATLWKVRVVPVVLPV